MTMYDLIFSKKAVDDLTEIWKYTVGKWSIKQADDYYSNIISSCKKISVNPFLYGMKYNEIIEGLFGCRIKEHIVFYKIENDKILVIRILHGRMDFKNNLG